MINIKTFYPYTNEDVDAVNFGLTSNNFDGIVFPVVVEEGRADGFRIIKQRQFVDGGNFISTSDFLTDFLRKIDLQDKKVFLSVVDLFNVLDGSGKSKELFHNLEVLRKAINEVYKVTDNIIVNNNLFEQKIAREEFFSELKQEFVNIDYAYTMFNRWDDLSQHQNIVAKNVSYYDVIGYINSGKSIYFPQFEKKNSSKQLNFEELLNYYNEDDVAIRYGFAFKDANIIVISKENANKIYAKKIGGGLNG